MKNERDKKMGMFAIVVSIALISVTAQIAMAQIAVAQPPAITVKGTVTYTNGTSAPYGWDVSISVDDKDYSAYGEPWTGTTQFQWPIWDYSIGASAYSGDVVRATVNSPDSNYSGTSTMVCPGREVSINVTVVQMQDITPPVVTNLTPADGTTVYEPRPTISADYSDPEPNPSGINVDSVVMKVDGFDVTAYAVITKSSVTFIPPVDLSEGEHSVYVELEDIAGNSNNVSWSFYCIIDQTPPVITNPTATPSSIPADGTTTSQLNVTVTDDRGVESVTIDLSAIGGSETQVMTAMGENVYSTETTAAVGTTPRTYNLQVNATDIYGNFNTSVSIPLTVTEPEPDIIVESITPNCGYLFGNESNNVSATIKNIGTADAGAFNVFFVVDTFRERVRLAGGLIAGESKDVTVTDPAMRTAGESVTISVMADCNAEVSESNETNNVLSQDETVVNNGYKGKRYTGGDDITTWQFQDQAHINLTYSTGDSKYQSGYSTPWTTYTANWTATDLPIPSGATIKKAVLYAYYTFDRTPAGNVTDYFTLRFNGNVVPIDRHYTDRKGYGSYNYPYGMVRYDVAGDFIAGGSNNAELNNAEPTSPHHVSLSGMMLMVVYEHADEPIRMVWLNEGFDIISARTSYCVTSEEATAYVPFTGGTIATATVDKATLVTVMQDAFDGDDKNRLYFNGGEWHGIWDTGAKQGDTSIAINETDVFAYLDATDNEARLQSHIPEGETKGDGMGAANAILVVEYMAQILPTVSISTDKTTYHLGDTMLVSLEVTNPGSDLPVRFAVWLEDTGEDTHVLTFTSLTLPAGLEYSNPDFAVFTLPRIPAGTYTWNAAIIEPYEPIEFISHDTAEWDFGFTGTETEDITTVLEQVTVVIDFGKK